MSTLFGSLSLGRQALLAQQIGLDVAGNNIANVNTPGYARQRAEFAPGDSTVFTSEIGAGVRLISVESYRSRLMDRRVNGEIQRQGEFEAASAALQQVEAFFDATSAGGLQSALSSFFNSFSSLANMPEDAALRQQVLARGEQLGGAFRNVYEQARAVQTNQNLAIAETVVQINSLAAAIAKLNVEVAAAQGAAANANNFIDQRQQLLDELAGLVDISYFEAEFGVINVTTRQGALLVTGSAANAWQVAAGTGHAVQVMSDGKDITASIESGRLGGLIRVRDEMIPSYLAALDDMAATIISRVNAQHALGADASGAPGGNFFAPFVAATPGSHEGAARSMEVAVADINKIAAGNPGAGPGSNENAKLIAAISDELLLSGNRATLSDFYSNLVFNIGLDTGTSIDGFEAQTHLVNQLQSQRDSVSGVSLDEEAISLMRYQKAFEASARFISVIDSLTEDIINILGD